MSDYEVINPKKILLVLVLISYVAIRVWHLSHFAFGFDEIFSIGVAKMSWGSMMRAIVADLVHPPLFYILLKLWIRIGGTSAFWLRLLPCILSLLIVVPLQGLCDELMLPKLAVATVFTLPSRNYGSIPVPEAGPTCDKARFPWHRRCEIRRNVWLPHEVCC